METFNTILVIALLIGLFVALQIVKQSKPEWCEGDTDCDCESIHLEIWDMFDDPNNNEGKLIFKIEIANGQTFVGPDLIMVAKKDISIGDTYECGTFDVTYPGI